MPIFDDLRDLLADYQADLTRLRGFCASEHLTSLGNLITTELNSHGCGRFRITLPLAMSSTTRPPHQRGRSQNAIEAQQSLLGKADRIFDYASLLEDDLDSLGLGEQICLDRPHGLRCFGVELTTLL